MSNVVTYDLAAKLKNALNKDELRLISEILDHAYCSVDYDLNNGIGHEPDLLGLTHDIHLLGVHLTRLRAKKR